MDRKKAAGRPTVKIFDSISQYLTLQLLKSDLWPYLCKKKKSNTLERKSIYKVKPNFFNRTHLGQNRSVANHNSTPVNFKTQEKKVLVSNQLIQSTFSSVNVKAKLHHPVLSIEPYRGQKAYGLACINPYFQGLHEPKGDYSPPI